jgi:6-phosphogluconolactonase
MRKIQLQNSELQTALARREFLKFAGIATLGLITPGFPKRGLSAKRRNDLLLYVGTYTTGASEGIYLYRLDLSSGELSHVSTTKGVVSPSFLTIAPGRRYLYAVNEVDNFAGKKSGAVSAFAIDQRSGDLALLNQQSSLGADPCYVHVDAAGKFVLIANYTGGNVAVFPVQPDGSLGEATDMKQAQGSSINRERQTSPHAHSILLDSANRFAYSCDLGTDRIMIFRFDARKGKLLPGEPPWVQAKPGAGPRHLTFHPNGKYLFVLNELHSMVTVFKRDILKGNLNELQTLSTLPKAFTGTNTGADLHVSPDGKFLYCSNRGHDSIACFKINPPTGQLTFVAHESAGGRTPRNFAIDPTGAFLLVANQNSDNIVTLRRDRETGRLSAVGHSAEVPSPVCVKFTTPFG